MTQNFLNFRRLLDPLPIAVFFDEHLDEGPAFVGGDEAKTVGLFGWDDVTRSLNNSKLWSGVGLTLSRGGAPVPAAEYCFQGINRDLQPVSRPDPVVVLEQLANGATLGLQNFESAAPGLMRLTQALGSALGGAARARLRGSGPTEPPELPDFDVGDAFHIQLEGASYWALFEERAAPGGGAQPEELAGELEMTAGDVLYLPAGQFYRTAGISEGCLTLTVVVMRPSGVELLSLIHECLTDEVFFRTDLPFYDDAAAHGAHLEMLAASIEQVIGGEKFFGRVAGFRRRLMALSKHAVFALPSHDIASFYRVGVRAEMPSGLDPDAAEIARWAQEAEIFTLTDLRDAFAGSTAEASAASLKTLEDCGFVEFATREVVA